MHDKSEILQIYLYDELVYKMLFNRYENAYVMSVVPSPRRYINKDEFRLQRFDSSQPPDMRLNLS